LSNNQTSLENRIDQWVANGGTCICCGIDDAMNRLSLINDEDKIKYIADNGYKYFLEGYNPQRTGQEILNFINR
jgi:hypothetical protein